jgi:peptide chain release factor 2
LASKKKQLEELTNKMSQPGFWDRQETAQAVISQLSALKSLVDPMEELQREVKDLAELYEMAAEEGDADELTQLEDDAKRLERAAR